MEDLQQFDVIIIGGSYAGLSAAMALGRSLRQVLVIDAHLPCNRYTPHSHNFLTQDGATPAEIAHTARMQVMQYATVQFLDDTAVRAEKAAHGFTIHIQAGEVFTAKKLLFATGLKDIVPDIDGFAACWGKSVIHCPYCHGYEYHGQPTGILANGHVAYHITQLVYNLTKELYIFTNGTSTLSPEEMAGLARHGIPVLESAVSHLTHEDGKLSSIVLQDGTVTQLTALYARPAYVQHCPIPEQLGCELTEQGLLKVDMFQKTTVEGVFAAGDNCAMRSVATAVYTGNVAGAMCNAALAEEDFRCGDIALG